MARHTSADKFDNKRRRAFLLARRQRWRNVRMRAIVKCKRERAGLRIDITEYFGGQQVSQCAHGWL